MLCKTHDKNGFVGILGVLVAVCIIFYLCTIALKTYVKNPKLEEATKDANLGNGIDASNYQAVLESSKAAINELNTQTLQREKEYEQFSGDSF